MTSLEQMPMPRHQRRLPQIRLMTLLLLTACAAIWCGVWIASREVLRLGYQLAQTSRLARELVVKDRTQLSVVRQDEEFFDENVWQIFVPREGMKIHLATAGIEFKPGYEPVSEVSAELKPGLHHLELKMEEVDDGWQITVQLDMERVIELHKDKDWKPNRDTVGGSMVESQIDFREGRPARIFQRGFSEDINGKLQPHKDGYGVVMWIE